MVTIKDIAAEAGVSKSTVSRVLTNNGYVGEETRQKILRVMEERGFQPSESARNLSSKTTNTIGVVVPEISNPFYMEVLEGIARVVDAENLTIIYCNTDNNAAKEAKALQMLEGQRVRGMILAPAIDYRDAASSRRVKELLGKINAPAVLLDRDIENSHMDSVIYDNFGSARCAAEELIKAGNRRIGMITGDMNLKIARDRFQGYAQAMQEHQLLIEDRYIYYGDFTTETAYQLSCSMLDGQELPDAVICSNNRTTLGLLRAIRERNMKFGREIAMIGIDHIPVLDIIDYKYSYVTRDTVGMGETAMQLLLKRMENPKAEPVSVVVPYQLVLKGAERKVHYR